LSCAWVHAWCCVTLREALACIVGSRGSYYIVRPLTKYMYARDGRVAACRRKIYIHVMLSDTLAALL
jgi:hypothetical protein